MFPFWIGSDAQTLLKINSIWLEYTAGIFGMLASYGTARPGPFACGDCVVPLDLIHPADSDQPYYRCRSCGLLKLRRHSRPRTITTASSSPTPQVLRFCRRPTSRRRSLQHILH